MPMSDAAFTFSHTSTLKRWPAAEVWRRDYNPPAACMPRLWRAAEWMSAGLIGMETEA